MGYFIAAMPFANLYILARGPDRNLDTFLDQANEYLPWVVKDVNSSAPPWEQFSIAAVLILLIWWRLESFLFNQRYAGKMPFTAFLLNAKMNVSFIGFTVLGIITLPLAIAQGSEDGLMFPAAAFGMIVFAFIVFLLEFLIVRTIERLFGNEYEDRKFKFVYGFFWSNTLSRIWKNRTVQRVWNFLG